MKPRFEDIQDRHTYANVRPELDERQKTPTPAKTIKTPQKSNWTPLKALPALIPFETPLAEILSAHTVVRTVVRETRQKVFRKSRIPFRTWEHAHAWLRMKNKRQPNQPRSPYLHFSDDKGVRTMIPAHTPTLRALAAGTKRLAGLIGCREALATDYILLGRMPPPWSLTGREHEGVPYYDVRLFPGSVTRATWGQLRRLILAKDKTRSLDEMFRLLFRAISATPKRQGKKGGKGVGYLKFFEEAAPVWNKLFPDDEIKPQALRKRWESRRL